MICEFYIRWEHIRLGSSCNVPIYEYRTVRQPTHVDCRTERGKGDAWSHRPQEMSLLLLLTFRSTNYNLQYHRSIRGIQQAVVEPATYM